MSRDREPLPKPSLKVAESILLEEYSSAADPQLKRVLGQLQKRQNVVLYGPPGTGKTRCAFALGDLWETQNGAGSVQHVTFHPSYSYEDFVEGFRPDEKDSGRYVLTPGKLLLACKAAEELRRGAKEGGPAKQVLMIVDEINRGDVARIFGELITYIEPDKRGLHFALAQSPTKSHSIPPNLFFVGTMNTADKSVSLLDVALRRRFCFIDFPPDPGVFDRFSGWLSIVEGIHLGSLLASINDRLLMDGVEPDRAVGHAMMGIPNDAPDPLLELRDRIQYDVYPLIAEYCYLDRARLVRLLPGLVTPDGRFVDSLSRAEFVGALEDLVAGPTTAPVAVPAKGDLANQKQVP